MEIDLPDVVAQVKAAFDWYEKALLTLASGLILARNMHVTPVLWWHGMELFRHVSSWQTSEDCMWSKRGNR